MSCSRSSTDEPGSPDGGTPHLTATLRSYTQTPPTQEAGAVQHALGTPPTVQILAGGQQTPPPAAQISPGGQQVLLGMQVRSLGQQTRLIQLPGAQQTADAPAPHTV